MPRVLLVFALLLGLKTPSSAEGLKASLVSFDGEVTVAEVLKELDAKTGNLVVDRRKENKADKVTLRLTGATFWQAIDALAKAAGCGVSLYQPDGQAALVDGSPRSTSVAYDGVFRLGTKRAALVRDDESGTHSFALTVEVAWEPRLQPLYLFEGPAQVEFGDGAGKVVTKGTSPGRGPASVAGRGAFELDLRFPAPPRHAVAVSSLTCRFKLLGPEKMLDFRFAGLMGNGAMEKALEGVKVRLAGPRATPSTWAFTVEIDNAPGNPGLESFQSWLLNNRIHLEKGDGPKRQVWALGQASEETELETTDRAVVRYVFETQAAPGVVGMPAAWTLVYRTPGRIVETPAVFNLKDVPLP